MPLNIIRQGSNGYQICNRCIMDTTDPEIVFDASGCCNHCNNATQTISKFTIASNSVESLSKLANKLRSNPGREGFHAIVGLSGGVDSSYLLHTLRDLDLKILAVHVDAGWNSIEAVRNINSLVTKLDLELETVVIDWNEVRNLQVAYLRSGVINQDVPQDHAFFSSLFKIAQKYKIKYVLSGSNYATESILPKSWGQNAMDGKQILSIAKKHADCRPKKFPITFLHDLYTATYILRSYHVIAPLNLINYSKNEAIKELKTEYGWKEYGGKHKESRFTDFFQEIYLPERFQIEKKRAHLSSLVVTGEITRNQALEEMSSTRPSTEEIEITKQFIATKLELSRKDLTSAMEMSFVPDSVYKNEKWLTHFVTKAANFRNKYLR